MDYVKAQHSVSYFHVAGTALFDVILTAVLLFFTGGAALVALPAQAANRITQFIKLGELLVTFAKRNPKRAPQYIEHKGTFNYEQAEFEPARVQKPQNPPKSVRPIIRSKPTPEEIRLANLTGATPAQISARKNVAEYYLENNGFNQNQIDTALGTQNGLIEGGIDLTKPVHVISFPPPDTMTQYVRPHGNPGNWFDPIGNQSADSLGLNSKTRIVKSFKMPQGTGLLSHAKPVVDDWTLPTAPINTQGGGTQLFVNDQIKGSVIGL